MSKFSKEELEDFTKSCHELIFSQKTIILATVSVSCSPDISYAPFLRDQAGCFYIYISKLASHTVNLLNNPQASIMCIRPESESPNLFARERAVFDCRVREITHDDEIYTARLNALQEKFGEVVSLLRSLPDFHLFELRPESGRYIVGFGRAFTIDVNDGGLSQI